MNRNQKGKASPSAVQAKLDDPPIHVGPSVPASAGEKDKNIVDSDHYGTPGIAPAGLDRIGFLCGKCQELGSSSPSMDSNYSQRPHIPR
jgi:hypothetical protein